MVSEYNEQFIDILSIQFQFIAIPKLFLKLFRMIGNHSDI